MQRRYFLSIASTLGSLILAGKARGALLGSVHFVDEVVVSDKRLKLLGTGLYYYKYFIKAAAAGLYLDERADRANVLGDVAKRLEMQYFWGIKATDLVAGSDALLTRNLSAERRAELDEPIGEMFKLYRSVDAGDRCAFMYVPEVGTMLLHNGKRVGTVPGADFAAAFFSIWFGEKPLDPDLKKKLLGTA